MLTILASLGQGQLRRKASTGRGGGPRTQPISLLLNMGSLSPQPLGLGRSAGPRAARLHDSPADENKEEDPAMPTGAGGNGRRKPHRAWSWELEHGRDTCASWVRAGRESLGVLRGLSLLPWTHPLQHGDPTPQPGGSPLVSSRMYQTVLTSSPAGADGAQAQSHHPRLTDQQSPGPSRPLSTPGLLRLPTRAGGAGPQDWKSNGGLMQPEGAANPSSVENPQKRVLKPANLPPAPLRLAPESVGFWQRVHPISSSTSGDNTERPPSSCPAQDGPPDSQSQFKIFQEPWYRQSVEGWCQLVGTFPGLTKTRTSHPTQSLRHCDL